MFVNAARSQRSVKRGKSECLPKNYIRVGVPAWRTCEHTARSTVYGPAWLESSPLVRLVRGQTLALLARAFCCRVTLRQPDGLPMPVASR